jgi:hypothetical protein
VKFIFRRVIAGCVLIGALVILYGELLHWRTSDSWFWTIVAAFAAMLAMVELMSPRKPLDKL